MRSLKIYISNGIFDERSRFFDEKIVFFENKCENIKKISKNILQKIEKHSIILYRVFFVCSQGLGNDRKKNEL